MEIYFDNAATTPLSPSAAKAYCDAAALFPGNPSSVHRLGQKAKAELEDHREHMAAMLGVEARNLIFTSGATESISLFFSSLLWMEKGTIVASRIEHEAVSSWMPYLKKMGWNIVKLRARGGFVSPEELYSSLTPDTKVVAIMAVNNVVGSIQDTKALVECVRRYERENGRRILYFSDSVQALGKTGLDLKGSDVDGASFSAHKINGPRGVGMLYAKNPEMIRPIASAGGQEKGHRGGTENLPGIAAFDSALTEWMENRESDEERISRYNTILREKMDELGIEILSPEDSTPYILSVASPLPSEVFTRMLMDKGFCVSSGSACSNNAKGKSEGILEAMGIPNQKAKKAIRISMGRDTEEEDVLALARAFGELING
ncbi:MAG: cysteine desulfurase family protein [Candidatus Ornithospirochaeta sp.]